MILSAYQRDVLNGHICPYCKSETKLVSEKVIYGKSYSKKLIVACKNYPACDSYVGTHKDGTALGRLANKHLRGLKVTAHKHFDILWKDGYLDRNEAYEMLSEHLNVPKEFTHIGMFQEDSLKRTIKWAIETLKEIKSY